jgi:Peptidase inhibitor family I36
MSALPEDLPSGVVKLHDGEPCPEKTLAVYRDIRYQGTAYGIGAGHEVELGSLPCPGGDGGSATMSMNVSSWVNRTDSDAFAWPLLIQPNETEGSPTMPAILHSHHEDPDVVQKHFFEVIKWRR